MFAPSISRRVQRGYAKERRSLVRRHKGRIGCLRQGYGGQGNRPSLRSNFANFPIIFPENCVMIFLPYDP
jgi:hypothetical protein